MSPRRQLQNKAAEFDILELQTTVASRLGLARNVQSVLPICLHGRAHDMCIRWPRECCFLETSIFTLLVAGDRGEK